MIPKLLAFSDVMRKGAATGARDGAFARTNGGRSTSPAAAIQCVPRLRKPLECRWRIDPKTGALSAVWFDPTNSAAQGSSSAPDAMDARSRLGKCPRLPHPWRQRRVQASRARRSNPPGKSRAGSGRAMRQG